MRTTTPAILLAFVLAATSCVDTHTLTREDHCAQQTGNQWCAEQYPDGSRPFCGRGQCDLADQQDPVALDGCLAQRPADDACYGPCGDGTTVLEDASCLVPEGSTGSSTTDDPSTDGGTLIDPIPACGNGLLEDGEACDDGELNGALGQCTEDCQGVVVGCGDGEIQDGELCDDGDAVDGNGCNADCRPSGMVVWEHQTVRYGIAYAVDVGADGEILVAGQANGVVAAAWAGRLGDLDGSVEWSYELPKQDGALPENAFYAVSATSDGGAWVGGIHNEIGHLVRLGSDGGLAETLPLPSVAGAISQVALLADGDFLVTNGWTAYRIDDLVQAWEVQVGLGLAYRSDEDVALAVDPAVAGFRRFTLDGAVLDPVTFSIPRDLSVESRVVAWTSDGDVVVGGRVFDAGAQEALILRSSVNGELRWMYGPQELHEQDRYPWCLAVDSRDAVIVGGHTALLGELRPFLMKLSSAGDVLWIRHLELQAVDAAIRGCTTTPTDEIIAVGQASSRFWFAKITP